MIDLSPAEIADLSDLNDLCSRAGAEFVIIGAQAYKTHFPNEDRETGDIDSAIALDLDDLAKFCERLLERKWRQEPGREHRWRSSRGTILDLMPAGKNLRLAKQLTWPKSGNTMSLVGFDHVFSEAREVSVGGGLRLKVIPPRVLMLLKIVAFLDRPAERRKDLPDIRSLLSKYEGKSDRLFNEEVLDAGLSDFSLANAFLLGLDLRALCTEDEVIRVREFISSVGDEDRPDWMWFVQAARSGARDEEFARSQLDSLSQGFEKQSAANP